MPGDYGDTGFGAGGEDALHLAGQASLFAAPHGSEEEHGAFCMKLVFGKRFGQKFGGKVELDIRHGLRGAGEYSSETPAIMLRDSMDT